MKRLLAYLLTILSLYSISIVPSKAGDIGFCVGNYDRIPWIGSKRSWNSNNWKLDNSSCNPVTFTEYIEAKFDYYFKNSKRWGKTDKELYSLAREALISEFTRNNKDTNKLYQYLPRTKYAYLESKTLVVKSESTQNENEPSFLCSIWQASSFKIINKINDKSRCTDLIYKDQNINFYNALLIYEGRVITNKQYTSLKQSKQKTQIAKVKPTIKPKNKVVKVVKATQKIDNGILFSKNDNLNFDGTKELWHAIVVHEPKVNIYRSDINSKINTKDKAINNAKSKCWFDPKYTSGDWPSENCVVYYVSNNRKFKETYKLDNKTNRLIVKKKLAEEIDFIRNLSKILTKGISLEFLGLEKKTYAILREEKIKKESKDIDKYIAASLKGNDLKEFNLDDKTLSLVKIKRQERKETLYAKTCTGWVFGHKKGTYEWFKCLDDEEQKELFGETKVVTNIKTKPSKTETVIKTTSSDNEPPVLDVVEALTVTDPRYTIEGKVTDKGSDKIYLKVDGQDVLINKGKFLINRYSPVDETIKITAIDKWGNEVTKMIKVIVNMESSSVAEVLEPLNASKIISKSSNNKVALIIGIENYLESPNATYANLDAKYFFDYARKGFGVKKQNINLLVDEQATFVKTNKVLTKWLRSKIKSGETELIIFFAGHGLASNDGKELYLLPQDSDPDLLARTALSRTELFKEIIALNPKSVTMFLDTCYSGVSRDEKTLLASARPIRIKADEQDTPNNFTIFSASQLDQISSGLKEAKHGIFSYYLMKGLEGKADANKDNDITNGELLAYMDENVSQKAAEQGRQQNPSLAGDPDKILMSYR